MPRARHFYTVSLVFYTSEEVKRALVSKDYLNYPPAPWYTSRAYYAGSSEAKAARALLKAVFDGQTEPLAASVILYRDGANEIHLQL